MTVVQTEWFGSVPKDWAVLPLKRFVSLKSGDAITADDIELEGSFPVFGGNGLRGFTERFTHQGRHVLIGRQGALCGNVNVADGQFFASEHAMVVTPAKSAHVDYLAYLLDAMDLGQHTTSAAQPGIGVDSIGRVCAPLPPKEVQFAIATYLDRETVRLDELIAEQEALLVALSGRRQAVIAEAVGVVALPTSGQRLKHVVTSVRQGWSPQCDAIPGDGVSEWAVLKTGCVNRGIFRPTENKLLPTEIDPRPDTVVRADEVLICRASTRDLVGSAAVVQGDFPRLMLSDKLYALTVDRQLAEPEFVALRLGTRAVRDLIELAASGASHSMQNISQRDIMNLPMELPSVDEQRATLNMLGRRTSLIDNLMRECRELITLLKERRSALITAAMTGKIDVRDRVVA